MACDSLKPCDSREVGANPNSLWMRGGVQPTSATTHNSTNRSAGLNPEPSCCEVTELTPTPTSRHALHLMDIINKWNSLRSRSMTKQTSSPESAHFTCSYIFHLWALHAQGQICVQMFKSNLSKRSYEYLWAYYACTHFCIHATVKRGPWVSLFHLLLLKWTQLNDKNSDIKETMTVN